MPGKPKPTQLRIIDGNPSRRPLPTNEPKPRPADTRPPSELSTQARRQWRTVAKQLHAVGLLTALDKQALALYCEAYARWREANAQLARFGLIVKAPTGYPMPSPYLSIAHKAFDQMRAMMGEFGMTPRSRVGLASDGKDDDDAFADLLD